MSMPRAIPPNKANPVSVRWAPDQGSKTAASARSPPHAIRKSGFDQTGNSGRRVHDHSYLIVTSRPPCRGCSRFRIDALPSRSWSFLHSSISSFQLRHPDVGAKFIQVSDDLVSGHVHFHVIRLGDARVNALGTVKVLNSERSAQRPLGLRIQPQGPHTGEAVSVRGEIH